MDEARLAADLGELAFDVADLPLKDLKIGVLLHRVSAIVREHAIVMPADLTLLFKALISLEGLGRQYDPVPVDRTRQAVPRPRHAGALSASGSGAAQPVNVRRLPGSVSSLPRDIARLVKDARQGRLRVELDLKRLDSFGDRLDSAIDRVTVGVMMASLVIGSSIVMTVPGGPTLFGLPLLTLLGLAGYLVAFVNSLWIIISIWRSVGAKRLELTRILDFGRHPKTVERQTGGAAPVFLNRRPQLRRQGGPSVVPQALTETALFL